jgi:ribosomal protein S18 acetylase RimI-like enzyme
MADLTTAANANLAATLAWLASRSATGIVERKPGLLLIAGPHAYPGAYFNAALRTDPALDATATLEMACAFFASRGRTGLLWATDGLDADLEAEAARQGLLPTARPGSPGMVLDCPTPCALELPRGASLEVVRSADAARRFASLVATSFEAIGNPAEATMALLGHPGVFAAPNVDGLLLTDNGCDVATAFGFDHEGVAGLYWIAVDPASRRRGFGRLATVLAIQRAAARGVHTIVLQATPFGEPLYRALGFRAFAHYRRYRLDPARRLS